MNPEETAAQVRTLADAGIDFIKDDELQSDGPHCPFEQQRFPPYCACCAIMPTGRGNR